MCKICASSDEDFYIFSNIYGGRLSSEAFDVFRQAETELNSTCFLRMLSEYKILG